MKICHPRLGPLKAKKSLSLKKSTHTHTHKKHDKKFVNDLIIANNAVFSFDFYNELLEKQMSPE
jgi:hypothetical protein